MAERVRPPSARGPPARRTPPCRRRPPSRAGQQPGQHPTPRRRGPVDARVALDVAVTGDGEQRAERGGDRDGDGRRRAARRADGRAATSLHRGGERAARRRHPPAGWSAGAPTARPAGRRGTGSTPARRPARRRRPRAGRRRARGYAGSNDRRADRRERVAHRRHRPAGGRRELGRGLQAGAPRRRPDQPGAGGQGAGQDHVASLRPAEPAPQSATERHERRGEREQDRAGEARGVLRRRGLRASAAGAGAASSTAATGTAGSGRPRACR